MDFPDEACHCAVLRSYHRLNFAIAVEGSSPNKSNNL